MRCADLASELGARPQGTAAHARGFVLVDLPLPWPRDAGDAFPVLAEAAGAVRARIQLCVPRDSTARRVELFHMGAQAEEGFARFASAAVTTGTSDVERAALELLAAAPSGLPDEGLRRLLLCTHGRRDACCGSRGPKLLAQLSPASLGDLEVRRTSHLGGHRFAPTALVLPEGGSWARVDDDLLQRLARGEPSAADVEERYRGCAAFASAAEQAADAELLARFGAAWLSASRTVRSMSDGRVAISAGELGTWLVSVGVRRRLPSPPCGADVTTDAPLVEELEVLDVQAA